MSALSKPSGTFQSLLSIEALRQDIRYTFRTLWQNKGFAFVAIVILAVGIGANTALFSTVNTVLLRQLPYPEPDRLVVGLKTVKGELDGAVSRVDYFDYREQSRSFVDLAALVDSTIQNTVTGGDAPELAHTGFVTWNLFRTLRVNPVVGRHFLPEEEGGGAGVVMLSYAFWQHRFGGSPEAIGSILHLEGSPFTVVGVMPRGFRFQFDADLWRLVDRDGPFDAKRNSHSHVLVGRLIPEVSISQAQSEVDAISAGLEQQYPDMNKGKGLRLGGLHEFMVSEVRLSLLLLMATTVLVLAIACGNVAGLLLARGQRRLSEIAMRTALGAPKKRLVRQFLTESMILTGLSGLAGIGVAYLLQHLVLRLLPMGQLGIDRPGIDIRALLFTLSASLLTGLIIGVVPAIRSTSVDPAQQLRTGTHASEGLHGTRLRSGLVVLQVAFSVVLLIGSGLLIRSLMQLSTVELGFDPEQVLTGQVKIQESDYSTPEERNHFFTSLLAEIETLPGVVSATMINKLPILDRWQNWSVRPADQPPPVGPGGYSAMARWVSPKYFETMRIPLLEGRDISATDVPDSPKVMVVSESVARTLFPGQDAIGRMVSIGSSTFELIGVVGDARVNTLRGKPDPTMYMASAQMRAARMRIAVRSSGDPNLLLGPIQQVLRQKDANVLYAEPMTMAAILDNALGEYRIVILSLSIFALVALVLTAIGLYGVLAYHVSQHTNEFGIRLAMGASNATLLNMILRKGMVLVGVGLLLGVAGAYSGTLLIGQLLFETQPFDPATYLSVALSFGFVAALACVLPAWRATRISLVEVLRSE